MIPDYMWGPIVTVAVFLVAQMILFVGFLWRQSIVVELIRSSMSSLVQTFDKYGEEQKSAMEIVHGRIKENQRKIEAHAEKLSEHGAQISHLKGVLNIRGQNSKRPGRIS